MKPEIKQKWLEALRSGKYQQGMHCLRREFADGTVQHCCLGVLCDLAVRDGVLPQWSPENKEMDSDGLACAVVCERHREYAYLPREVQEWADIEATPCVIHPHFKTRQRLHVLNDDTLEPSTFAELADMIEASL